MCLYSIVSAKEKNLATLKILHSELDVRTDTHQNVLNAVHQHRTQTYKFDTRNAYSAQCKVVVSNE